MSSRSGASGQLDGGAGSSSNARRSIRFSLTPSAFVQAFQDFTLATESLCCTITKTRSPQLIPHSALNVPAFYERADFNGLACENRQENTLRLLKRFARSCFHSFTRRYGRPLNLYSIITRIFAEGVQSSLMGNT